jgi:hypothetical protein
MDAYKLEVTKSEIGVLGRPGGTIRSVSFLATSDGALTPVRGLEDVILTRGKQTRRLRAKFQNEGFSHKPL